MRKFFLFFALTLTAIYGFAQSVLTPEIMWGLGRVGDMQVSPDGRNVIYTVTTYDIESNSGKSDIFLLPVGGGEPQQLTNTPGTKFNVQWRPDSRVIGYLLADEDGAPQFWEMYPDGSGSKKVTRIQGGIRAFLYSPKMDNILYVRRVKIDKTPKEIHADLPKANARIIEDMMYRHWNKWHDYSYNHIFVATYSTNKVSRGRDIMSDEPYDAPMMPYGGTEQIAWSPDGSKIVYVCKKLKGIDYTLSTNSEIYIYDVKSRTTICLTEKGFDGYDLDPVFSPDGNRLAWISMKTPGFESDKKDIIIHDFKKNTTENISSGIDQSFSSIVWDPSGRSLYAISGINATYQIFSVNIDRKQFKQLTEGRHNYQSISMAGRNLIGTKMSMSMPTEIFRVSSNGRETQLSFTNSAILDSLNLAEVEERWIETTDNKKMLVWVIYPPGFDKTKKYPALLYCQGGPQSAVSQFWSYRWNFQMMAAHGYVVVAPNRRGLPSFGQEWNDQISGDYGGQNMKDYLSAIDALAKEPFINKDKLGAIGASYGGFSVFWLAGNHQKRFSAFISHCGMFNLESMYGSTEEYFFVNHDLEGPYWQSPRPQSYDFSPHKFVSNWDTPIMVIHGEHDYRIPYTESLQAFHAAQLKGIPSRLLFFPEETHFILKPQNSILWNREFFRFLNEHLK